MSKYYLVDKETLEELLYDQESWLQTQDGIYETVSEEEREGYVQEALSQFDSIEYTGGEL